MGRWLTCSFPRGTGPFPAVLVPFYEPLTSIGQGAKGKAGTHDYGLQMVKRGCVTLSIGTPGSLDKLGGDTRGALTKAGEEAAPATAHAPGLCRGQLPDGPHANARSGRQAHRYHRPLLRRQVVDVRFLPGPRFACAVWSDPGIVFNEKDSNVNYWEPWYLGYDPKVRRKPGVPSEANPRTGLYKELIDASEDLVDLHALDGPSSGAGIRRRARPAEELASPQSLGRREHLARIQESGLFDRSERRTSPRPRPSSWSLRSLNTF